MIGVATRAKAATVTLPDGVASELRFADADVRRALARELHDRVAQTLTTILIDLENFKTEQAGQDSVLNRVEAVQGSMREVLSSLRDLLHDLRGDSQSVASDMQNALSALLRDLERRTGIIASLVVQPGWPARTKPGAAANLYRIAEEALTNVARHSGAKRVVLKLRPLSDELCLTVTDYGRGFDPEAIAPGFGTTGMRERAVLLGARLWIDSYPGSGTSVHVTMPRDALAARAR